ncbi:autoinducer binding domain-containing protein [Shinella sp.]|uniref:autoinducer binding domain-containing protein n=1 Tax=Shinella sp. TaxID=1870904 RepID=UPI003D2DB326
MATRPLLLHCIDLINSSLNTNELNSSIHFIRKSYRLAHLVFHVVHLGVRNTSHPLILSTYPKAWIDYYIEKDFFDLDPVLEVSRIGLLPVDWSCLDHANSSTRGFFRQADSFGVGRFGISIPIRGPRGERSLITATSNLSEHAWTVLRADCVRDLQILALYIHDKALTVSGLRLNAMQDLSRRQLQCIDLIAQGQLPKQIAALLGVSESTVRLHVRLAKRKLGGSTTTQAVSRAVAIELIRG